MTSKQELLDVVEGGISYYDARQYRGAIRKHTGLYVPRRPVEIDEWIEDNKSVLTRKLRESVEESEASESAESKKGDEDKE